MTYRSRIGDQNARRQGGIGTRYDSLVGASACSTGANLHSGKRFCETCQRFRPRGRRPALKGWRCAGCL